MTLTPKREPLLFRGLGLTVLRTFFLAAMASGWVAMTKEQLEAWMLFFAALSAFADVLVGLWIRRDINPVSYSEPSGDLP
jgi:hypothetical protein